MGAAATANAGGLVAAGGAALSAGAGAVASAASALFGTASGSGEGASSGSTREPLPRRDNGARSKRKVICLASLFGVFLLDKVTLFRHCFILDPGCVDLSIFQGLASKVIGSSWEKR